ncbi:MAG TPA: IclR family transcriptional regulator [Burkholderiales bacterium]|nr:IclR family transcriptional regulator [Burkholderiales bacterium]
MADRTLLMFEAFAGRGEPLTLSELARLLSIPVSTCFNLMRTLQARGYLYEVGGRKMFYPTARLLEKARAIASRDPIRAQLQPHLEALRDETGETVILGKRLGDEVVYLSVVEGVHSIRYTASVGDLKPLYSSAAGKALLGALPAPEREALVARLRLARVTAATITQRAQLLREIDQGVKRGWFTTRGENVADVMALAAPVNVGGDTVAVALAGPIHRMEPKVDAQAKRLVADCKTMERRP